MRYELLALIFMVSIVSMVIGNPRKFSQNSKHANPDTLEAKNMSFCKINLESTNMASKAAAEAKAAKDAQPCASVEASRRVMEQMAQKAEQAACAAESALRGKRLLLEQLLRTKNDTDAAVEEIKDASSHSQSNIEIIDRITTQIEQILEQFQCLYDDIDANLVKMGDIGTGIDSNMRTKQLILSESQQRINGMRSCLAKAKDDLERTECIAEQAASAAREAKDRIDAVQEAYKKIKRLRKKDVKSLRWILKTLPYKK